MCVDIRYVHNHYATARYNTIRLGSTLPKITLLECTWYLVSLVEAEPNTKWVDRAWVEYISTSNVIVARPLLLLLCAYSRESTVWLSYAHDLGQAALGAGHEAGRPCVLATIVMIRTSMYGLRDSTAALLLLLLS